MKYEYQDFYVTLIAAHEISTLSADEIYQLLEINIWLSILISF